jgi:hypothetical protein
MSNKKIDDSGAVIVCKHVFVDKLPILFAERLESDDDPVDTGWAFSCNVYEETVETGLVLAKSQLLKREPSLAKYMDFPVGTKLTRENKDSDWNLIDSDSFESK